MSTRRTIKLKNLPVANPAYSPTPQWVYVLSAVLVTLAMLEII